MIEIMRTVEQIEDAIRGLTPEEFAVLRSWFTEFDAVAWDQQIARDVADGRLDSIAEEALADLRKGRCTDL